MKHKIQCVVVSFIEGDEEESCLNLSPLLSLGKITVESKWFGHALHKEHACKANCK